MKTIESLGCGLYAGAAYPRVNTVVLLLTSRRHSLQLSTSETVANYWKQWLLQPMVSFFGPVIEIYAVSRCAAETNFSFAFFPDDISCLNHQEKLFVDDPTNAQLFDECSPLKPQSKRKHSIEDTPGFPKTKRTEDAEKDEVSEIVC